MTTFAFAVLMLCLGVSVLRAQSVLWESVLEDFSDGSYVRNVEASFQAWENANSPIVVGEKGRVGLKVYTHSGSGLATPLALTRAVIKSLEVRGYKRENLFIVDLVAEGLRESGYLPPRSDGGKDFEGVPVYVLREGDFYDALWFYENPLPARTHTWLELGMQVKYESIAEGEDRKSFLPVPLIAQADFWINLPMVVDSPSVGVSGALANATLWNASNTRRFQKSPANAPVAVAEMAAIPELKDSCLFTLMTLERYQFIGGTAFNSLYTSSEPLLWMSSNPVALDYFMLEKMNRHRIAVDLPPIAPRPLIFDYAEAIGLGSWKPNEVVWKTVE